MAENKISYVARNYDDYKREIRELTRKYYPDVFASLNDASIGEWLIELAADIGDNLSFHTDRVFQETNIDSANQMSSLNSLARTNGLNIPGQKAAIVEVELSCEIPVFVNDDGTIGSLSEADESYCPYIKRGTLFSNGMVTFELDEDVDFKEQFNRDGYSNRQIIPNRTPNGNIESYTYTKLAIAIAAQSKVYKMIVQNSDIEPFMSITLSDKNILGIESILVRQGENISADPSISEYYVDEEMYFDLSGKPVQRYFEVDNLIEQFRFGYAVEKSMDGTPNSNNDITNYRQFYNPIWYDDGQLLTEEKNETIREPIRKVAKGQWKRLKNKFITEYTDDFKLKITFGAGIRNKYGEIPNDAHAFTQYMMSRMYANDYMGVLPEAGSTLYVLYKVGGGEISNIAANTLTNIISLDFNIGGGDPNKRRAVKDSIKVTNPTVSYGGKDMPNADELRYLIKYNNSAQNRCVTINDYYAMLNKMPGKFGLPFRIGVIEENNKISIYTLGLDYKGHLTNLLSETVAQNMKDYLSMYKMINDFIEIKSGKIINVAFDVTIYVDKSYDRAEVVQRVINKIADYMDVRRHQMGEDIYLGDLQKEITQLDGVVQFVSMKVKNMVGDGYSEDETTQQLIDPEKLEFMDVEYQGNVENIIDLEASDYILFSEANSMHEIKSKENDIKIVTRVR